VAEKYIHCASLKTKAVVQPTANSAGGGLNGATVILKFKSHAWWLKKMSKNAAT
jgi:hypothetical protein